MAYTDRNDLNYLGILYEIGANQTPFLSAIGGLNKGGITKSFTFPLAQPYSLASASQPAITEAVSVASNTATTITRAQDYNTVQIFQETVEVSHAKQSTAGDFSGIQIVGEQPVTDELSFQKNAQLRQIAIDVDYSFLQGTYQLAANSTTAAKTRGLVNAITTNTVAGGSATLTKAMVDSAVKAMADTGSPMQNVVAIANSFQKQQLTNIYAYAPDDRNVGGVNIKQIETDFAMMGVMYDPHMPTDEVFFVEMSVCKPMFCKYDGQIMVYEILAQVAASKKAQWYSQIGIDYGPEEYHGAITGLATS